MFVVVRSIFWLTAAYLVIKPSTDLPDTGAMAAMALSAGRQSFAEQVEAMPCQTWECAGGKAIASAVLNAGPPAITGVSLPPTGNPAPLPRPRPARPV